MRLTPIYFLALAILIISCKASDAVGEESNDTHQTEIMTENGASKGSADEHADETTSARKMSGREIIGTWRWVKTSCCGRMTSDTYPNEEDDPKLISFDMEGNAKYFGGDEGNILMDFKYTIGSLGDQVTIRIGERQPAIFYVKDDQLTLSWGYMDLQIEYYEKVEE